MDVLTHGKIPTGAIDVYRIVKKQFPQAQLLLIAGMAPDDPEGWLYLEKTARHAGEDPDIHFLTDLKGVGNLGSKRFPTSFTGGASNVHS